MSVEKWNKWVAKFEGYIYRTLGQKAIAILIFAFGVMSYYMSSDYGEHLMLPCALVAIALFLYDKKSES